MQSLPTSKSQNNALDKVQIKLKMSQVLHVILVLTWSVPVVTGPAQVELADKKVNLQTKKLIVISHPVQLRTYTQ